MPDVVHIIQFHFNIRNMKCVCQQQLSPISILVHYIDKKHRHLGVKEQDIDTLCGEKLILAKYTSTTIENKWAALKAKILKRNDYGKDVCLFEEQQTITLYGLPHVVKYLLQQFEEAKMDSIPSMDTNKSKKLGIVPSPKLYDSKTENDPRSKEAFIDQEHNQINPPVVQTRSITFDIDEPGFEVLVNHNFNQVLAIVQSKCLLDKQIIHRQIQIEVPKAKSGNFAQNASKTSSPEHESKPADNSKQASSPKPVNWFLRLFQRNKSKAGPSTHAQQKNSTSQRQSTSSINDTTSITIGNSRIIVCIGDLTKQVVSFSSLFSQKIEQLDNLLEE